MINRCFNFLSSLKLTLVCLGLSILLVVAGTLAQVKLGLYVAQTNYFKAFFVYWQPVGSAWKIPVFPGGYLVGITLLANLVAAHIKRFQFSKKKIGIVLVHAGLILLLLGQLLTDMLSVESGVTLAVGETKNYSEDFNANELAVINATDPNVDEVVSIPERLLLRNEPIQPEKLPFTIRVKGYWPNSDVVTKKEVGAVNPGANQGVGAGLFVIPLSVTATMDSRNMPSATLEIEGKSGTSLGTWFLTTHASQRQEFTVDGKKYELSFRFRRHYTPYSITLVQSKHDIYVGTDIPKNFSSKVRLENPVTHENREVLIYMNNPLRYAGLTYYQYQMGPGGMDGGAQTSTLQVVRNPNWITPYLACVLAGGGLLVQFLTHLIGFAKRGGKNRKERSIPQAARVPEAKPQVSAAAAPLTSVADRRNL